MQQSAYMLFLMIAGHAYADFALQSQYHSGAKHPGNQYHYPWYAALTCHSLIHGGLVALITGSVVLGIAETVAHWLIDCAKGRKLFGMAVDQIAHIGCKFIWIGTLPWLS
jgi:hypothetical protein